MRLWRFLMPCAALVALALPVAAAPDEAFLGKAEGYPLGKPGNPELQTRILRAAFALLEAPGPPPVLRDFESSE